MADAAVVSARAAERLRHGAVHVARADVVRGPSSDGGTDTVQLCDERGRSLGSALWAEHGPIAARLYDRSERPLSFELIRTRISAAHKRRLELFADEGRDAYRVVHGEADLLPGLFVDRYADAAVLQTATAAMDSRKELLADALCEALGVARVICRDDGSARDLEGLPREKRVLRGDPTNTKARFHDAKSLMEADLLADRKTGSFLDQQENHAAAFDYATRLFGGRGGRALDCFTYHGGFALALQRAGLTVSACDENPEAIGRARHNAALNHAAIDFRVANAFDLLRSLESAGEKFSVVVIDPPALAKRGRSAAAGQGRPADGAWERAYKELNLRGLRLLAPGGLLISCSCSGRVSPAEFGAILDAAARDVGKKSPGGIEQIQIVERRGAGRDHPPLLGWPESEYLKCWILRAVHAVPAV